MIVKKTSHNKSNSKKTLSELLMENGFTLPLTEEDVEKCDQVFGTTDIILPKDVDSPDFIFERLKNTNKKLKGITAISTSFNEIRKSENDYFKKIVLAAEIAYRLYNEPTFGHKKFVKIYFICEEICELELSTNYLQYAAGPLDPKHLHVIDAEFKRKKWFQVKKRKSGYGFEYAPDINVLEYQLYYNRYFKIEAVIINKIVELFRRKSSDFCEIVATLLASWLRLLGKNIPFEEQILFDEFYEWSTEKKKFRKPQLIEALEWMRTNEIVPIT